MKVLSIIAALMFSISGLFAGDGIEFLTGDYDFAVKKAKSEQKLMLLDFTASWCAPCKKMDREVFPDKELGTFVNDSFVPFKVNADYFWGMDIAEEYNVKALPTILILDNKGKIVKRIVGYQTADDLLNELRPLSDFESLFSPE